MPVLTIQRRMRELGRIRMGEKDERGYPKGLANFRLTSASQSLLEAAAKLYGGEVRAWTDAPDKGYYELLTESSELDVLLPPVFSAADGEPAYPYSQFFEDWSGKVCRRRCDGVTELLSGDPCPCAEQEERTCKITTRVNLMLPRVPSLGVWRLESHGWNAASYLPGTLDLLAVAASQRRFIPATLRIEQRSVNRVNPKSGKTETHRFAMPVLDLPGTTAAQLVAGDTPAVINPPPALPAGKPPLLNGGDLPADPSFAKQSAGWGARPPLPMVNQPSESSVPEETPAAPHNIEAARTELLEIARHRGLSATDLDLLAAAVGIKKGVTPTPEQMDALLAAARNDEEAKPETAIADSGVEPNSTTSAASTPSTEPDVLTRANAKAAEASEAAERRKAPRQVAAEL